MKLGIRQKVEAVKALPNQIAMVTYLAITALLVAFIAMAMSVGGVRRAN